MTRVVHLIDDDESIRKSCAFLLRMSGFVPKVYASGVEFLRSADQPERGCILLDVRMPGMDGLEVQKVLRSRGILLPVVILTGHGDISIAVQAMRGGAVDFLEKPFERDLLLASIEMAFDRLDAAVDADLARQAAQALIASLTPRERQVLSGLVQGHPNKTIAYDLGISSRTVEVHRASLMDKLAVRSLSEALRLAFTAGMFEAA